MPYDGQGPLWPIERKRWSEREWVLRLLCGGTLFIGASALAWDLYGLWRAIRLLSAFWRG
jgi:hypothetical protein